MKCDFYDDCQSDAENKIVVKEPDGRDFEHYLCEAHTEAEREELKQSEDELVLVEPLSAF